MADAVDAVDELLVQVGALDQSVQVHQRLDRVLEATVDAIHEVRQLQLNHTRTSKVYIKVKVTRTRLPSASRI